MTATGRAQAEAARGHEKRNYIISYARIRVTARTTHERTSGDTAQHHPDERSARNNVSAREQNQNNSAKRKIRGIQNNRNNNNNNKKDKNLPINRSLRHEETEHRLGQRVPNLREDPVRLILALLEKNQRVIIRFELHEFLLQFFRHRREITLIPLQAN